MGKKLAIGVVIGAVAGIVAGVLTAPKSGKETRDDIKAKADDLKDKASKASTDAKDKIQQGVDHTVETAVGGRKQVEEKATGFFDRVKNSLKD